MQRENAYLISKVAAKMCASYMYLLCLCSKTYKQQHPVIGSEIGVVDEQR